MTINKTYGKFDDVTTKKTDLYLQKTQNLYQKIKNLEKKNIKAKTLAIKRIHNLRKDKFVSINIRYSEDYYIIQGTDTEFNTEQELIQYIFQLYPNSMVVLNEFKVDEFLNVPETNPRSILVVNTTTQTVILYSI